MRAVLLKKTRPEDVAGHSHGKLWTIAQYDQAIVYTFLAEVQVWELPTRAEAIEAYEGWVAAASSRGRSVGCWSGAG
ncbi:hypothetical protein ACPZ19_12065 [Amycolatopsis lurida]